MDYTWDATVKYHLVFQAAHITYICFDFYIVKYVSKCIQDILWEAVKCSYGN